MTWVREGNDCGRSAGDAGNMEARYHSFTDNAASLGGLRANTLSFTNAQTLIRSPLSPSEDEF